MIYVIFKEVRFGVDTREGDAPRGKYIKKPVCVVKTHRADQWLNKGKLRKVAAEFFGVPEASISVL
jgi:hypothetical protein